MVFKKKIIKTTTLKSILNDMAINMEAVRAQRRELNMVSDEVFFVKRRLMRHQEILDAAWQSTEIKGIDSAMEELLHKLKCLAGDLEDLGYDVLRTGVEIKAEAEAAKVAAAAGVVDGV